MQKDYKINWRKKVRITLAKAFGGKCAVCGYGACIGALDYHHLDPNEKDFALSKAVCQGGAWHKIVKEIRKCTIICCRCHRELHYGFIKLPEIVPKFNEEYADFIIKEKEKKYDNCIVCGKLKNINLKFCSPECSSKNQEKFIIEKEKLEELIKLYSCEEIGRMYNVSGHTVKRKILKLNIE